MGTKMFAYDNLGWEQKRLSKVIKSVEMELVSHSKAGSTAQVTSLPGRITYGSDGKPYYESEKDWPKFIIIW